MLRRFLAAAFGLPALSLATVGLSPLALAQQCIEPLPNLVAWWPGDGNTDDVVGGIDGTLEGGATFAGGVIGQAFDLRGPVDFVNVPGAEGSILDFAPGSPITIDAWAFRTSAFWPQHLVGKRSGCGADFNFYQLAIGTGALPPQSVPLNEWVHLAVTVDGGAPSAIRNYVNGIQVGPTTFASLGENSEALKIGNSGTCVGFSGLLDEVEIYDRSLTQAEIQAIFEAGSAGKCMAPAVTVIEDVELDSDWTPVAIPQSVSEPVVIAGAPTFRDTQPGLVRLRNITSGSVEARFQEWSYLDDEHPGESLAILALGKGRHEMDDGSIWEVGELKVRGNRKWKRKKFQRRFRKRPELFLTVQSNRGETPVTVRARNVTKRGFEAALLEEERELSTGHPRETVGYLAVFSERRSGTVTDDLGSRPYRLKRAKATNRFKRLFGELIKVQEERSRDRETRHGRESISTLFIGDGVFAQQITDREPDTTTIRRREP